METRANEDGAARKKPRFTVAQAARAFRMALGGEPKIEMTDEEGRPIRHIGGGRWVLRESPGSAETNGRRGKSTPTAAR